jgi:hypothetical protein
VGRVMKQNISSASRRLILKHHTSMRAYLVATSIAGATRYDSNGESAGTVSEAAAVCAANRLAKIQRREAAKKPSTPAVQLPTGNLAIVPSRNNDGDDHVKIPISQSDQCRAIEASLGIHPKQQRAAPLVVVKKSRRVPAIGMDRHQRTDAAHGDARQKVL